MQTVVIYKPELFDNEYQHVFEKYSGCVVIRESDFFSDFLKVIDKIDTEYILFGVDDVVFFESVDFAVISETFDRFSDDIFGYSLRFGKQSIKKSDHINETKVAGQMVYSINWTQGQTPTTRYPFELCATIYKTELVKKILKSSRQNNTMCEKIFATNSPVVNVLSRVLKKHKLLKTFGYFYNPNTLESWNCRWCQNHAEQMPSRIYFQKLCASTIQVNMVNTSIQNTFDGDDKYTVEALNDKYKQGYRLDINFLASNKPISTHCAQEVFKITKNTK
jgi:hypothetical protein